MNLSKLDALLKDLTAGTPLTSIPAVVPPHYAEVLKWRNGAEGFLPGEQYLVLWSSEQLVELNAAYSVADYLPGVVLIGTNGGDTAFGIDRDGKYIRVPLIGMSPAEAQVLGNNFEEFISRVVSDSA